jgi:hypothetical protein
MAVRIVSWLPTKLSALSSSSRYRFLHGWPQTNIGAQDPERIGSDTLDILLKLKRIDDLTLHFKGQVMGGPSNGQTEAKSMVTGLTFIHTATQKDAKRLLTTDFNADPNVLISHLSKLMI